MKLLILIALLTLMLTNNMFAQTSDEIRKEANTETTVVEDNSPFAVAQKELIALRNGSREAYNEKLKQMMSEFPEMYSSSLRNADNTSVPTSEKQSSVYTEEGSKTAVNVIPDNYSLKQNYPNPFNPETTISFSIPGNSNVALKLYDISGKEIMTIINKELAAGNYDVSFNGSDLSSGIYFYTLTAGEFTQTMKMTIVK